MTSSACNITFTPAARLDNFNDYPGLRAYGSICFAFTMLHIVITVPLFFYLKECYLRLRVRSSIMLLLHTAGVMSQQISGPLSEAFGLRNFSSFVYYTSSLLVVVLVAAPLPLKLFDYSQRAVLALLIKNIKVNGSDGTVRVNGNAINVRRLRLLRFTSTGAFRGLVASMILVPYAIYIAFEVMTKSYINPINNCHGGELDRAQKNSITFGGGAFILVGLLFSVRVHFIKVKDTYGLLDEIKTWTIFALFGLVAFLLSSSYPSGTFGNAFTFNFLVSIGLNGMQFAVCGRQIQLARREEGDFAAAKAKYIATKKKNKQQEQKRRQMRVSALESDVESASQFSTSITAPTGMERREDFKADMKDDDQRELFSKYVASEFSSELMTCWEAIQQYKREYHNLTTTTQLVRYRKWVNLFVRNNSVLLVNLSYTLRQKLIKIADDEELKTIDIDIFQKVEKELEGILFGVWLRYQHAIEK